MQAKTTQWRYTVDEQSGCWLWRGTLTPNGYALYERNGGERIAHRAFYVLHVGPIPKGHHLHHVCATKRCVNPAHLQPLTAGEHNAAEARFSAEDAQKLRGSGLSYIAIAQELGCSRTTAYRLVNPAYKQANVQYKRDRLEHYRQVGTAYHRRLMEESPNRCMECGAGMSPRGTKSSVCIACRQERSQQRKQTIQQLWSQGRSLPQIAEALNTTVNSVGVTITNMRQDGWDVPLRYKLDERGVRIA